MGKFQLIVADPPWLPNDKLSMSSTKRGAEANYDTLDVKSLCDLNVNALADPNGCVLVMWCLGSMIQEALDVMAAWKFQNKQIFVWVKSKKNPFEKNKAPDLNDTLGFGMGRLFRQTHELAIVGINSTGVYKLLQNKSQRSVVFDFNQGHSKKPEILQDRLETMFPGIINDGKAIELFARRSRENWVTVGNEICNGEDIKVSIQKLLDLPYANIIA